MGVWPNIGTWHGVIRVVVVYLVCVAAYSVTWVWDSPWSGIIGAHCGLTIVRTVETLLGVDDTITPVGASTLGVSIGLVCGWHGITAAVLIPLLVIGLTIFSRLLWDDASP